MGDLGARRLLVRKAAQKQNAHVTVRHRANIIGKETNESRENRAFGVLDRGLSRSAEGGILQRADEGIERRLDADDIRSGGGEDCRIRCDSRQESPDDDEDFRVGSLK